ncbi:hypothetical protein HYPSUDRAFT_890064 [Hypholoma sublateritium FD-334 SS-4]|uniref:Uncharacterized protein n=1 Tax=Hypholoma sublateritium (strain FD-334 SS-4) TaxID=945553 RepID=A0A0D2PHC6_HYPSF|nr:hypothetical protein HYPSUDRAFT_890064 [Hypholoma sublateritium FD-334 SS-4]
MSFNGKRRSCLRTRSLSYDPSSYQGSPSSELDALWESTYASGIFRVSGQEQELFPNRTARLTDGPDGYTITFSQKYMALRYRETHPYIRTLRQTSMYMPDTTPLVQWDRGLNKRIAAWYLTHSCVDYKHVS